MSEDDLIDFTPQLRAEALTILEDYTWGELFTPPSLSAEDANRGTILMPGAGGGANWSGAGVDPETGILYVPSSDNPTVPYMVTLGPDETNFNFLRLSKQGVRGPQNLPILKPPYSSVTAIDMNRGEILWQVANGEDAAGVTDNPALSGIDLPPLGGGGRHPLLVTATLLIHAQNTTSGPRLVARDKATGAELGTIALPAAALGAPMSYALNGKQYIALSIRGAEVPELVVFALPD